ncbi:hypothetical protein IFM89_018315 [Coptis chinensis]|uniref:KIB1-4 beta-propeller domain-containing protein n=1 Tax=Coptis chinensis TaxID=261450 RepID=A0A835H003_9MAGN|nr:hypothetical protein IFM89_018315 [Coptis chinensis]
MAICGELRKIAYATLGDEAWTSLEGPSNDIYEDIIFFNDHFYAMNAQGYLRICDFNAIPPKATDFASPPDDIIRAQALFDGDIWGSSLDYTAIQGRCCTRW